MSHIRTLRRKLIATAEIIDGLPFVRVEHVIGYKTIRSSERDLQHLDALANFGQPV
ncbi:MAG: hypothetical protein QNK16_00640 [Woeseiaceae bacterium]|nr:hypothetical protein [Woeseiaceae bacterium]MDX2606864.1 hypothetical protein [Woeseiaceae bacterium]